MDLLKNLVLVPDSFTCFLSSFEFKSARKWLKESTMNKKRETIRKPEEIGLVPDWDAEDTIIPTEKVKPSKKRRRDEDEMLLDKQEDD